ncbi:MAG: DUF432 domain-containing protein [Lentisphaerae bacterium]|nr:DUF432 domain-containing protein [Lentisphaerota bacterium]
MNDALSEMWVPQTLEPGKIHAPRIGPLQLWLAHRGDELHLAAGLIDETDARAEAAPAQPAEADVAAWRRWVCGSRPIQIALEPRLPPRPVIVRPAMPVTVLPGEEVAFFVSIPIRVAVLCVRDGGEPREVCEEPSVLLSNSWFGPPIEGELCYAVKTHARRHLDELRHDAHLAVCPVTIQNADSHSLTFERLCLRTQSLGIYAGTHHLWTNRGTLVYRGDDHPANITFETTPPPYDRARRLVAEPRKPHKQSRMMRAFGTFKSISGF